MKTIPIRYITVTQKAPDLSGSFSIKDIRELLAGKDMVQELHRHDYFFILALQHGNGTHEIDFTNYKVSDNAVFFVRPGQVHQLALKKDCTGYILEFTAEFYHPTSNVSSQRLRKASHKNFCKMDVARFKKIYSILASVFREYREKKEGYPDAVKANLDIFFIELVRQSQHPGTLSNHRDPYAQERLEEFSALLEMHITTHKEVSHYTRLMNLSPYQLNEITKATRGKTSSALINEYIILEAKRYLLATAHQIKDIADHLGYEDVSYFTRFFKRHTGYSPEAFRHHSR